MRNNDQKCKDMIESVLASTARTMARAERRRIHKRRRARELRGLRAYRAAVDPGALSLDLDGMSERDMGEMVDARRSADKVGPLVRWAQARVDADADLRDAPISEQVEVFARLLPDTLIGRHALMHIEQGLHWHACQRGRRDARRCSKDDGRG